MTWPPRQPAQGFTLIELIVVMMLLATVLAMAAPRLSGFMAGRDLNEETRRLVALTRYARSEAINRSARMELWIDPVTGEYGLRAEDPMLDTGEKTVTFQMADNLAIENEDPLAQPTDPLTILFWPDGLIDEDSPERLTLTEKGEPRRVIALSDNRLEYVVEEASHETP